MSPRRRRQPHRHVDRLWPQRGAHRPYIGHRRDEYFLATKCGCPLGDVPTEPPRRSPTTTDPTTSGSGIEPSLRRLGTDRLDLLQVHMSPSRDQMEADQTVETMLALRDEGKIRFLGMSGTLPASARPPGNGSLRCLPDPLLGPPARARGPHHRGRGRRCGHADTRRGSQRRSGGRQGLETGPLRPGRGRRSAPMGVSRASRRSWGT